MNLYEGYQALLKKDKGPGIKRSTLAMIPLAALLALLLGIGAYIGVQNAGLNARVKEGEESIAALEPAYSEAEALLSESEKKQASYESLATGRLLFNLYPPLEREIFAKVRASAENVFVITEYQYDETNGVLIVNLNAASVNEVPKLVERLRDTELFQSVQYTGYTSDSTQRYYCTVGCTLDYQADTTEQGGE